MPTIGEQLKQARQARKFTLKQAVQATRVRVYYLEAMEADDFSAMPSPAQARGFLRLYAEFLGLNADELIASQRGKSQPEALLPAEPAPDQTPPEPAPTAPQAKTLPPPPPVAEAPAKETSDEAPPAPESKPGPPPLSQAILVQIGASLRERRELLSLTLDEIERHTHIRRRNLELVEAGEFDELPSPVQARGMLGTYASFLDMDTDAILLRYADALQMRRIERQPFEPSKPPLRRVRFSFPLWLRRFISPDLIFGGGMIVLLLALSVWGAARLLGGEPELEVTTTPEGPSISEILLATPVGAEAATETIPTGVAELATALPTIDPTLITPTETPTLFVFVPASSVQVTVIILERTFLRVTVDGEVRQDGRVAPGAALTFDGNERIEVLTGSGAAVQIIYNRQDLGVLGNLGEVVDRIYTVNGVETPTPTASPTPSATPRRQPSQTPTATLPATETLTP
jgi:cytoskeletal protein RodZ